MWQNQTTSELLVHRNDSENQIYLKWLGDVYPRFHEYYEGLGNDTGDAEAAEDQYKFPLEMFCAVNIPRRVSSI